MAAARHVYLTIIADFEMEFKMARWDGPMGPLLPPPAAAEVIRCTLEMPDCSLQVHWTVIGCNLVGRGE